MLTLSSLTSGYQSAVLALAYVTLYLVIAALGLRRLESKQVLVVRYDPPRDASPGVAAWLLERGELARAMAAAVVNMAAKGYLRIEQRDDLSSLLRVGPEVSLDLEPEEDALARTLFMGYDCFDFDQPTSQLRLAIEAFQCALRNTGYFSRHIAFLLPAWIVSGLAILLALLNGNYVRNANRATTWLIIMGFGCFIVAVRTLPGTFEKMASRLPGSTAPKRPWSGGDGRTVTLLAGAVGGIALLGLLSTTTVALLTTAFLAINAVFFHKLQGPTRAGRKIVRELIEYRKFLAEVDADVISRMNSCEKTPSVLNQKIAYALAFHLDLGWSEQFVTSIADLIESAEVFGKLASRQIGDA